MPIGVTVKLRIGFLLLNPSWYGICGFQLTTRIENRLIVGNVFKSQGKIRLLKALEMSFAITRRGL
jgi:hypothetical protein